MNKQRTKRIPPTGRACLLALVAMGLAGTAGAQVADPLRAGFLAPPSSAKPRVWWHWMDGNVSEQGIREDLEWLDSIGIGGVHNFDAALNGGPTAPASLVPERVAYLTPRWRELFRLAVEQAHARGMEFTIAASPGWSESGGPWVKPPQGMKKLVWSETSIAGGRRFHGVLAPPPRVTGPFQDIPLTASPFAASIATPEYYADSAVVAYRHVDDNAASGSAEVTTSAGHVDAGLLSDGKLSQGVSLPYGEGKTDWIQFSYAKPQRMQAITVAVERPAGLSPSDESSGGSIWLEAAEDGKAFHRIATIPRDGAPQQTIAFPATTARAFRLVLSRPAPGSGGLEALFGMPARPAPTAHVIFECVLHAEARVNRFEDKEGFTNRAIGSSDDTAGVPARSAIATASVVDLTGKMTADGTLDWTPPAGKWVVLRMGYSLTGRTNHPASREGTGLEVDKLNAQHVKSYAKDYLAEYEKTLGPQLIGRGGLQYMLTDSYEAGSANWTDDILTQFAARRGYDPKPWLPVLAGRVVGSSGDSDRFLWDFRHTLGDLIADAHYGALSAVLHEHGMGRYGESHESGRAFVGDGMQVKKSADVPMGALWSSTLGQPRETFDADIRESASVAHIYGQNLVAAESLTAFGNTYAFTPATLKPFADRELAMGLNRFVIHTSVHQPDERLGPGATLGPFGQWFTRHETWARDAGPWVSYLTRSAYLLQQGQFVADIAYLYGEDNNITNLFGRAPPPIPPGYNFDYVNADALVNVLTGKVGRIVAPSGMQYRLLALDASTQRMSLPVLKKIRDLVAQGVDVVGARPDITPSLADSESEFNSIADSLWKAGAAAPGRGRVFGAVPLADALRQMGVGPDCLFLGAGVGPDLRCVHRRLADRDLYFVANGGEGKLSVEARFRVTGRSPELWHADTGTSEPASYRIEGEVTVVPLELLARDSVFVVFGAPTSDRQRQVTKPAARPLGTVAGPWNVSFTPGRGAPARITMGSLASWTSSADAGVKYYSGTATYTTTLNVNAAWLAGGSRVHVDLGEVKDVAEVSVNGKELGTLWKPPYEVDVTDALHAGDNAVDIRVTNTWPNRMIGDKQPGAQKVAYATFDPFKADSPLLPAGLLGPVTVVRMELPK